MGDAPDNLEPDDLEASTSDKRTVSFHYELNSFICNRSEEWDLNPYEIIGVLVSELFEQLKWASGDEDDEGYYDEDEDEEDEEDEDEDEDDGDEWKKGKK